MLVSFGSGAGSDAFYMETTDLIEEKRNLAKTTKQYIENKKYKNQKVYVIKIKKYAYAVPYIVTKEGNIFLKTLYPSRKLTKQYINKHNE